MEVMCRRQERGDNSPETSPKTKGATKRAELITLHLSFFFLLFHQFNAGFILKKSASLNNFSSRGLLLLIRAWCTRTQSFFAGPKQENESKRHSRFVNSCPPNDLLQHFALNSILMAITEIARNFVIHMSNCRIPRLLSQASLVAEG